MVQNPVARSAVFSRNGANNVGDLHAAERLEIRDWDQKVFQARSGMSVGSGGREPFKRTTQNIQPPTKKSSRSQAKPAEPAAPVSRAAPSAVRKRDPVASLFSARRPARRVVQGGKATKPGDQQLKNIFKRETTISFASLNSNRSRGTVSSTVLDSRERRPWGSLRGPRHRKDTRTSFRGVHSETSRRSLAESKSNKWLLRNVIVSSVTGIASFLPTTGDPQSRRGGGSCEDSSADRGRKWLEAARFTHEYRNSSASARHTMWRSLVRVV
ncbi:hypothetical protein ALC60_03788 [Trachymyrmex zeteki]|uniref:Uncharacterized protein n=1 Tax=Mycetomoellerius zeteki TaxID=64791 RepID=A0A151XA67_9HYME|nr:hypothetical protein ALC60_03788 [Trachymyrmex zeteki]